MTYKVRYLPVAVADIEKIAEYLASFAQETARGFLRTLRQKTELLSRHPNMYAKYPENSEYHRIIMSDYVVFYKVNDNEKTVDVYRVLRNSWDVSKYMNK